MNAQIQSRLSDTSLAARDYDPSDGRWVSKDPSRFRGRLNLYGYCYCETDQLRIPANLGARSGATWATVPVHVGA